MHDASAQSLALESPLICSLWDPASGHAMPTSTTVVPSTYWALHSLIVCNLPQQGWPSSEGADAHRSESFFLPALSAEMGAPTTLRRAASR